MARRSMQGRPWKRMRERVQREQSVCWLCGGHIDPELRFPDPGSFSVDHVEPVSVRPDLRMVYSNLRASHLICNTKRGAGKGMKRVRPVGRPSREW